MGFKQQSITSEALDQIVYGDLLLIDKQKISCDDRIIQYLFVTGIIQELFEQIPPKNSSLQTFKELKFLEDITNKATDEELQFSYDSEMGESYMYETFAKSIGLNLNDVFFSKLFKQIDPILMLLKNHFNRPRPYQLAYRLGINLKLKVPTETLHPAYPSGHALDSHLAAYAMIKLKPEKTREILLFCEKMEKSRLVAGVHFPSDNNYSKFIFDILVNNNLIKIPEIT